MLVEIVTAPLRPAWEIISDSRSTFSGLAFNKLWGILRCCNKFERISDFSTLVVPTKTGRPSLCKSAHSSAMEVHFPSSVL